MKHFCTAPLPNGGAASKGYVGQFTLMHRSGLFNFASEVFAFQFFVIHVLTNIFLDPKRPLCERRLSSPILTFLVIVESNFCNLLLFANRHFSNRLRDEFDLNLKSSLESLNTAPRPDEVLPMRVLPSLLKLPNWVNVDPSDPNVFEPMLV